MNHFYHPKIGPMAKELISTCKACQLNKAQNILYGQLPPHIAHNTPWSEVTVDLIGPWPARDQHSFDHTFHALTIIDTVTNYCEIMRLKNKTAEHVAKQFKNQWLAWYPRPNVVIFDPGPDFKVLSGIC